MNRDMLRLRSTVCPFCEARSLWKAFDPSWKTTRGAATLQKRRPSRTQLSSNVQGGPPRFAERGGPTKKSRNSPFGGMNRTAVPKNLQDARNSLSAAEQRRQSRFSKDKKETKTRDPMKALKMQRALTNVSYEKRGRVKESITERSDFEEFDLLPIVKESISPQALKGMVNVAPTPIQRLAIPALLGQEERKRRRPRKMSNEDGNKMQQFLLAAETGSGKTLAYLLPVIDAIKRAEAVEKAREAQDATVQKMRRQQKAARGQMFEIDPPTSNEPDPSTARPRAIILVPTSELAEQVGSLVKSLAHTVKYRSTVLSANYTGKMIRSRLFSTSGIDVVVCTPHLLSSITETDPNVLSRVSHLVIDEADSLLDRSFSPITSTIIDRATPSLRQLILCSATIPKSLDSYLHKRYTDIRRLVTPNLHAIPRRVQLSVVDIDKVPYQGNRDLACAQVIWDIGKEVLESGEDREKKLLVFVNEREKTVELAEYLKKKGIDAVALSRDSDERKQADVLASFTGTAVASAKEKTSRERSPSNSKSPQHEQAISPGDLMVQQPSTSPPASRRESLPNTKVLITTDIASRGIDTLPLKHVILYDVPHTSIDFIHRLGRVGRMNRRGRGIVLVGRHDRKDIVKEVREGMFKGAALI